jgi:CubicO group peptidase (beta-lactamase class C family)
MLHAMSPSVRTDKEIASLLTHHFEKSGPGAVVGIQDQEARRFFTIGQADLSSGRKITPKTPFDLASVTKVLTGVAITLLEERGAVNLSDPIQRWLAGFRGSLAARPITVRDLLWHVSGIPDYLAIHPIEALIGMSTEEVLDSLREGASCAVPGVAEVYCNSNYLLLAEIIQVASGQTYQEFLNANVFGPAGMARSCILQPDQPVPDRAVGYRDTGYGMPRFVPSMADIAMVGDGGALSCAADMVQLLDALLARQIVRNPEALFEPAQLDDGTLLSYGRGFILESLHKGVRWIGHTGGWPGTATLVGCYLPSKVIVVVLSNDENARPVQIAQRLIRWHEFEG